MHDDSPHPGAHFSSFHFSAATWEVCWKHSTNGGWNSVDKLPSLLYFGGTIQREFCPLPQRVPSGIEPQSPTAVTSSITHFVLDFLSSHICTLFPDAIS